MILDVATDAGIVTGPRSLQSSLPDAVGLTKTG